MKSIQPKMEMDTIKWYKLPKASELDYSKITLTPKTSNLNQEVVEALRRKIVENGDEYAWENCDNE